MRKIFATLSVVAALAVPAYAQNYGAAQITRGANGHSTILYGNQNFNGNGYYDGRYSPTYQGRGHNNGAYSDGPYPVYNNNRSYANGEFIEGVITGAVLNDYYRNVPQTHDYSFMGPQYQGTYMQQYLEQQGVYNRPQQQVQPRVRPGYSEPVLESVGPVFVQKSRYNKACKCIEEYYEELK